VLSLAIAVTRAWTATYTRGLPGIRRAERREEIDCDLWEQQRGADLERTSAAETALEIVLRLLLGVPSDIAWRLEAGRLARSGRETRMKESNIVKAAVVLGIAVSALTFFTGVGNLLFLAGDWEDGSGFFQRMYGLLVALAAAAVIIGLVIGARKPYLGLGLVAGGSVATIVLMFWIFMITIPISAVLVWIAYARAGKPGWPGNTRTRPTGTA